jgi:hypothetical protein
MNVIVDHPVLRTRCASDPVLITPLTLRDALDHCILDTKRQEHNNVYIVNTLIV